MHSHGKLFLHNNELMKTNLRKRLGVLPPIISVALGLTLLVTDPLPLQGLRNQLFDQYQRWYPRDYVDVPVRIIDIDQESLARLGQWPWPRTRLAELVKKLKGSGTAAIGFDVVFAEPDRTSPRAMLDLLALTEPLRSTLASLPDNDTVLAQSLAGAGVVLGFADQNEGSRTQMEPKMALSDRLTLSTLPFRYVTAGEPPGRWLHPFHLPLIPLPNLANAAEGIGALSFVPDSDGVVRRVPLVFQLAGESIPTLVAEVLRVAQGEKNYFLKTAGKDLGLAEIRIGQFAIPTTAQGEVWVHFSNAVPNRYLSAWKVLAGEVPAELLDGHMALIGSSAQGLMDLRFSPFGQIIPGVEVHAQALEQILSGQYLQRPGWATALESLVILVGGLVVGFVAIRFPTLWGANFTLALLGLLLVSGWYAFREQGLLINTVVPALTLTLSFTLSSVLYQALSERERRRITSLFSRYVSPNRVRFLVDHPEATKLGGSRQECSFIFTDLAGFTSLMETIDPSDAVAVLNDYLDRMISIAFRHDGTLDRIVGDAVAIMFSAPIIQLDHRARALACAQEMDAFASEYSAKVSAKGIPFGKTRIGIHSGEVIVGNFGGSTMFDYRALGDPVNTAARLEGANKYLGTNVCLSEDTLSGCRDVRVRPIGRLVLKGKSQALQVYEPVTDRLQAFYAPVEEYVNAYANMTQLATCAVDAFRDLAARFPVDPLVALHYRRLSDGESGDLVRMAGK